MDASTLKFEVLYCSSEDPNHPFQYLFRNDVVSGWVSSENPNYPIDVIIDLKGKFILTGIEIVSHQYMIPQRVDLYGTTNQKVDKTTNWESIGFFNFHPNYISQWKARELKRIMIDNKTISYLRMIISECHQCPLNQFHQSSFISLEINGRYYTKPKMTSLEVLISDLTSKKLAAVEIEDYTAAADYKTELDNISKNEALIRNLFNQKAEALSSEDYLTAESIVQKILDLITPSQSKFISPPININYSPPPEVVDRPLPGPDLNPPPDSDSDSLPEHPANSESSKSVFLTESSAQPPIAPPPFARKGPKSPRIIHKKVDPPPSNESKPLNRPKKQRAQHIGRKRVDFSSEPPKENVDTLSDAHRSEAEFLINLFGESPVAEAYSSGWSHKVNGYKRLCELIKGLKSSSDKTKAFKSLAPLTRERFKSGLKAVFCSSIEDTISLIDSIELPSVELSSFVHQFLPLMLTKMSDTNPRISEAANRFVLWSIDKEKSALNEVSQFAVKPPNASNQYLALSAKLSLLKVLIEKHGLGKQIKTPDVMKLAVTCLESRKAEVRQQAFELLIQVHAIVGSVVDKYLISAPRILKEQLKAAFAKENEGK